MFEVPVFVLARPLVRGLTAEPGSRERSPHAVSALTGFDPIAPWYDGNSRTLPARMVTTCLAVAERTASDTGARLFTGLADQHETALRVVRSLSSRASAPRFGLLAPTTRCASAPSMIPRSRVLLAISVKRAPAGSKSLLDWQKILLGSRLRVGRLGQSAWT